MIVTLPMEVGQIANGPAMLPRDGQFLKAGCGEVVDDIVHVDVEFSKGNLYADLPHRGGTHQYSASLIDQMPRCGRECPPFGGDPKRNVGIKE